MRRIDKAVNIADLCRLARKRVPRVIFDFVEGGVEDEVGMRTNTQAFERIRLLPTYLVDTSATSQKTRLFGREYASAFGIAPTGLAGLFRYGCDFALARVARETNIPFVLSGASNASMEEIARVCADHLWFQVYGARNRDLARDLARRSDAAGIRTLVMTVDVPVPGRRERNIRNGLQKPYRPSFRSVVDSVRRPFWLFDYWRNGGLPMLGNWRDYAPAGASAAAVAHVFTKETPDASQCWRDLRELRDLWKHKLVIKGILNPKDALTAKSIGVDGIIVSNHGGRQLDRAPAPIEVLPSIRAAVGPDMTVMLDSGVRRGSDIVSALCLGADFVFVGRATLWGAIAGGDEGVRKAAWILMEEMRMVMSQIGASSTSELGPDFIWMQREVSGFSGAAVQEGKLRSIGSG